MLHHLLGVARAEGLRQVSLETGTMAEFAPARALYESAGFTACGPFADYRPSDDNCFAGAAAGRRGRVKGSMGHRPPSWGQCLSTTFGGAAG